MQVTSWGVDGAMGSATVSHICTHVKLARDMKSGISLPHLRPSVCPFPSSVPLSFPPFFSLKIINEQRKTLTHAHAPHRRHELLTHTATHSHSPKQHRYVRPHHKIINR